MKQYSLIAYTLFLYSAILADSTALTTSNSGSTSSSGSTTTSTSQNGTLTTVTNPAYDITEACTTNPRIGKTVPDANGNQKYSQVMINRTLKHVLPKAGKDCMKHANMSILHGKTTDYQNYPVGSAIFPQHPELDTSFTNLITTFKNNTSFIKFFRKIHLNALNELYDYLMKIYANFNLQHVGTSTVNNQVIVDVQSYLQDEAQYATSKKTLIINHLVNIIEAQFNGTIRSIMKGVPSLFATHTGKTMILSDFSVDLSYYILQQEEPILVNMQNTYLTLMGQYLTFFESYTGYLKVPHSVIPDLTEFINIAQHIQQFLGTDQNAIIAKMDPPMFFFDADSFRALKIIPKLAQDLPSQNHSIQWPANLITAIQNKTLVPIKQGNMSFASHPVGYFRDKNGDIITDPSQAVGMYIVLEVGQNLYEQEVLAEPAWMGSPDGIMKILRACLGDLHQLVGLNILDPITETIIAKSYSQAKNIPYQKGTVDAQAEAMIAMLKQNQAAKASSSSTGSSSQSNNTTSSTSPATGTGGSSTPVTTPGTTPNTTPITPTLPTLPQLPSLDTGGSLPTLTPDMGNILPTQTPTFPSLDTGGLTPSSDNISPSNSMLTPSLANITGA